MKTRPEYSGSEIRSGLLVAVSIAVLLSLLFLAGDYSFFEETRQVRILFDYVSGLGKNAPVHFAGYQVGKVTDIQLLPGEEAKIRVTASISKDAVLQKDSGAFIDTLGLMGEKFVELTPGSQGAAPLEENGEIRGVDPVAMNKIVLSLQRLIEDVNATVGENRDELNAIFKNLAESSKNLAEMSADLKAHPWKLLKVGKEKKPDDQKKR